MRGRQSRSYRYLLGGVLLAGLLSSCGGEETSKVNVSLYGWADESNEFVDGMPEYADAHQVRVKVTRPEGREILTEQNFPFADRRAILPDLPVGEGVRLDFEVRDFGGAIIAAGNTPIFDAQEAGEYKAFRTMVSRTDQFAPVGQMVRIQNTTEQRLVQSRFDSRQLDGSLGRVGHTVNVTSRGEVLVVGGGDVGAFHQPTTMPNLLSVHSDIQLFDPSTGYFTELAGDSQALSSGQAGVDRLRRPRAFHTVTDLGSDRYLVLGGFELVGSSVQPSRAIELIDLRAAPGQRVQTLNDFSGTPIQLQEARGLHTATLRGDGRVIVAGGIGSDTGAVRDTFEIVNPAPTGALVEGGFSMQAARVGHGAVLMEDGQTVWLLGGRNGDGALSSTEVLQAGASGTVSEPAAEMTRSRFGASYHHLGAAGNNLVAVFGGFTGLTGGVTAAMELGRPDSGLQTQANWRLNSARGNAQLFVLPQSRQILLVGGLDADFNILTDVEWVRFLGVASAEPFFVDESRGTMYQRRGGFAAAQVSNGRILLVGGQAREESARNDAEYFNPRDPVIPPRR